MDPKSYLKRGISLLIVGQLLNIFRYGVPQGLAFLVTGDLVARKLVFLVFSSDIMQFAGLTFLLLALLTHLRLNNTKIFLISIAMNIIGMVLSLKIETGNYAVDQLLGLFVFTRSESYFPMLHWFIYPAYGILFGNVLKMVKDKKKFYLNFLAPLGVLTAAYYIIALCVDQPVLLSLQATENFNAVGIFDALMQLACNTLLISIAFFITNRLSDRVAQEIHFIAGNINRFYCVQWVLISCSSVLFAAFYMLPFNSALLCYAMAFITIVVTWLLVYVYVKYLSDRSVKFFSKRKYMWYALVLIVSIALCMWAFVGEPMPNMFNDYLSY